VDPSTRVQISALAFFCRCFVTDPHTGPGQDAVFMLQKYCTEVFGGSRFNPGRETLHAVGTLQTTRGERVVAKNLPGRRSGSFRAGFI